MKPIIIALVLTIGFIPQHAQANFAESGLHYATYKPVKAIPAPKLEPLPELPVIVPPPPPVETYTGTGDSYLDWIVSHESGGDPHAVNPSSGSCGLFQEWPCGKSGCTLDQVQCQIAWGRQYAISAYGSTYGAYLFWQSHHWW